MGKMEMRQHYQPDFIQYKHTTRIIFKIILFEYLNFLKALGEDFCNRLTSKLYKIGHQRSSGNFDRLGTLVVQYEGEAEVVFSGCSIILPINSSFP